MRMPYTVSIANKPKKFTEKQFPDSKERIKERLQTLSEDPYPHGVIPLEGRPHAYRMRVGPFRIQYLVLEKDKTIVIFKISRRDENTYK